MLRIKYKNKEIQHWIQWNDHKISSKKLIIRSQIWAIEKGIGVKFLKGNLEGGIKIQKLVKVAAVKLRIKAQNNDNEISKPKYIIHKYSIKPKYQHSKVTI